MILGEGAAAGIPAAPTPNAGIDLRHCTDVDLLMNLIATAEQFDVVHMDAPWMYRGGKNNTQRGLAGFHYDGLSEPHIASVVALSAAVAKPDTYLVFWCTFPKLLEWARMDAVVRASGWQYVTGGMWGKLGGLGAGYHLRGDAELILVYKKGQPAAQVNNQSDMWLIDVPPSLLWTAQRSEHSQKPIPVLRDLLDVFCVPGGRVLNIYSGNAATMERACRDTQRTCVSCEADAQRWAEGWAVLNRPELFPAPAYDRYGIAEQLEQMMMEVDGNAQLDGDGQGMALPDARRPPTTGSVPEPGTLLAGGGIHALDGESGRKVQPPGTAQPTAGKGERPNAQHRKQPRRNVHAPGGSAPDLTGGDPPAPASPDNAGASGDPATRAGGADPESEHAALGSAPGA